MAQVTVHSLLYTNQLLPLYKITIISPSHSTFFKFQVMKAMKDELRNSGLTEEEILHKTQILMKAFRREDPSANLAEYALASKQKNAALKQNNTSPKDFTNVRTKY